ncbi:MAG: NAD-dependent epimerase/dehydratase family protein, partial [Anaerolineaceae bacterium]|nr:NAD-dependent epimerase/dehydratase family protein [Anaerolineaceae bacterium]
LQPAVQGCRFVFHCAAALSGEMRLQRQVNVDGTRNIAQAAADAGMERFVHISTLSVYGQRKGDINEEMKMTPDRSPYSITKTEGERAVHQVAGETGLGYTILRPGAIYGPRGHWTRMIFSLARRNPIWFVGPGTGVIPLIYMDDLLEECWLCATHPAAAGQAFNAVYEPHPTIRQTLLTFASLVGQHKYIGLPITPIKVLARGLAVFAPPSSSLKMAPAFLEGMVEPVRYSMDKAQRVLGWQPQVDLAQGVQKSLPWMKEVGLIR